MPNPRPRALSHTVLITALCLVVGLGVAARTLQPRHPVAAQALPQIDTPRAGFFTLSPSGY